MTERFKIDAAKNYLRRKYPAATVGSLATLQTMADAAFAEATDTVTVTSVASEGAQTSGSITFEKVALLSALNELIDEYDPEHATPQTPRLVMPDFSLCQP